MKVNFLQKEGQIKLSFDSAEMTYLSRLSKVLGIPLTHFGGLSNESPFILIRVVALCDYAEHEFSVESIVSKFGISKKISFLEALSPESRAKVCLKVATYLRDKLPPGFFVKKS